MTAGRDGEHGHHSRVPNAPRRKRFGTGLLLLFCAPCLSLPLNGDEMLKTAHIRIRDPFIYADAKAKTYYMYAQSANRRGSGFKGVEAYASEDLVNWSSPEPVLTLPKGADVAAVWAPEMHEHKGAYYLFVTLTQHRTLPEKKPVNSDRWPTMQVRGTHVYRADTPLGPFKPLAKTSHTPEDWMALDGTLLVEDGVPYMVFCHEWVQVIDGTMDVVQLKDDLSGAVGSPEVLFKASDAPGGRRNPTGGNVTDGCFLYRSPRSHKLFMIWSTFVPGNGYCVVLTESQSGKIRGPWINQKVIYKNNGGHGMLFQTFDGHLLMALHQPNGGAVERLHLYNVTDNGEGLEINGKAALGPPPARD
jgi:GH43 family beta-xylosidase